MPRPPQDPGARDGPAVDQLAQDLSRTIGVREAGNMQTALLPAAQMERPQHQICNVRTILLLAVGVGVGVGTALRSVPNLVFNGEDGMAAELGYTNTQRGAILSAFGWAYTVTQVPGGCLSQAIGPTRTLLLSVSIGSTAGLLMPAGATISFMGPLILNAIIGLSQGPLFPVMNGLLAKWLRPEELGRGNALLWAAWNAGQIFQFLLSPVLLKAGGWRLAWYVYAPLGLLWCLIWACIGANSPREHPRMKPADVAYIEDGIATKVLVSVDSASGSDAKAAEVVQDAAGQSRGCQNFDVRLLCQLIVQRPVWVSALCAMLDGASGAYANWMPQYYSTQMGFDISGTGIVVAAPLVVSFIFALVGGAAADSMLDRGSSTTSVRRWFNFVPTICMVCCILGMVLVEGCETIDRTLAVTLQCMIQALNGFKQAGVGPIPMDVSKKYAALIMGIINCTSNLTYYALANNLIGLWLDRGRCPSDPEAQVPPEDIEACAAAWTGLFIIEAIILFVSVTIFTAFIRADPIDQQVEDALYSAIEPKVVGEVTRKQPKARARVLAKNERHSAQNSRSDLQSLGFMALGAGYSLSRS